MPAGTALDDKAGEAIRQAILESSQIILKQYRQFCYGSSQEGYLYPSRYSYYQEPFFYYPMSFHNRIGEIPHNVGWRAWAVRRTPIRGGADDTQAPIDYVNPSIKKQPANNPLAMVKQIQGHIARSRKAVEQYRTLAGEKADAALIAAVQRNCTNGQRIWREILIAIELYSCYFAKAKGSFFKQLGKARQLMLDTVKVLGPDLKNTDRYGSTTANGPFIPDKDAEQIEAILAHQKDKFPFEAPAGLLPQPRTLQRDPPTQQAVRIGGGSR